MKVLIINGPNLNLLGQREPHIYGSQSFESYFEQLQAAFPQMELEYFQSNSEGALIDALHRCGFTHDAILLNAGAYTHSSIALADAVSAITTAVFEIHISNTYARESFRQHSYLSSVCQGVIVGFGLKSYYLALASLAH